MTQQTLIPIYDPDFALFDEDLSEFEYSYLVNHAEGFKVIWTYQTYEEKADFVDRFYQFAKDHGLISSFPCKTSACLTYFSQAKTFLTGRYAGGSFLEARELIDDVAYVALHNDSKKVEYLNPANVPEDIQNIRRTKLTRLFEIEKEPGSENRVSVSLRLYMKFCGAVCRGLARVLETRPQFAALKNETNSETPEFRMTTNFNDDVDLVTCYHERKALLEMSNLSLGCEDRFYEEGSSPDDFVTSFTFKLGTQDKIELSMNGSDPDLSFGVLEKYSDGEESEGEMLMSAGSALKHFLERREGESQMDTRDVKQKKPKNKQRKNKEKGSVDIKLHHCAFCHTVETEHRTFKKCGLCKGRGTRFYCGAYCQVKHWIQRHHRDHN